MQTNRSNDYRNNFPSLIKNENMTVDFNWQLWGAEVDLISIGINGEKSIITQDEIANYLQGILDRVVLSGLSNMDTRDAAIHSQEAEGKSPGWIARYLKGWDAIDKINELGDDHE